MKYSINALHKTATVFLNSFFRDVSRAKKYKYYSRDVSERNARLFKNQTDCFLCPVRGFPAKLTPDIFYIFVIRNPLDILVSEYFSFGWTHTIKGNDDERYTMTTLRDEIQQLSIDAYCLKYADTLYKKLIPLLGLNLNKESDNYYVVTYEELVTDFEKWSTKMFELVDVPEDKQNLIYSKYVQEFENIQETTPEQIMSGESIPHKRKVLPGDHLVKLKSLTVATLNNKFKDFIEFHGLYGSKRYRW